MTTQTTLPREYDDFEAATMREMARVMAEHAAINPNEPTRRIENQKRRARLHEEWDDHYEQLLIHREALAFAATLDG